MVLFLSIITLILLSLFTWPNPDKFATWDFIQATEKITKPWHLLGLQAKEYDDVCKLRYQMPGLAKEDVKLTEEDGVLNKRGEHEMEEEEEGVGYGYYSTRVLLPDDAKVDEIEAEKKDGVLNIVVPKSERANKDVKEIEVM